MADLILTFLTLLLSFICSAKGEKEQRERLKKVAFWKARGDGRMPLGRVGLCFEGYKQLTL